MRIEDKSYARIRFAREGRILTAILSRPDAMNAVDGEMHEELATLFYDLADDEGSDVVVLTGDGKAFCAGGDLVWLQNAIDNPDLFLKMGREARRIVFGQLELEKPLICRLNGAATGLGASLALFSDIIIGSSRAVIGDPHVSVGLVAGDGGCIIWPQLVGYARAREYLFTGKLAKAEEAERIGLINRVVAPEQLDEAVYGLARELAAGATRSIRWTKITTNAALKALAHQVFDMGLAWETVSNLSKDHQEAISAFRERRTPAFTGR